MRSIFDLPVEVLAMVFEVGFGDGDLPFVCALCLTCRSWYQLAISLPRLWSQIFIEHYASIGRVTLWIERSRSHLLDFAISLPPPYGSVDPESLPVDDRSQPQATHEGVQLGLLLTQHVDRWRKFRSDSWWEPTVPKSTRNEETAGWEDLYAEFGMKQPIELEEMSVNWSGAGRNYEIPKVTGYPKLRKLTLERTICHWAPHYMVPSLTYMSLVHVDELPMRMLLEAMKRVPCLQEIYLNEVVWDISTLPTTSVKDLVTLSQLFALSVTGGAQLYSFIDNLILPNLRTIVLVDNAEDLSPTFHHLSTSTTTIEHITTGMWGEEYTDVSQRSLVDLIVEQQRLVTLSIRDVGLSDEFILALLPNPSRTDPVAPMLRKLQIPMEGITHHLLPVLVQSRNIPDANVCRLQHLILLGDVASSVVEEICPFVDILEVQQETSDSELDS